MAMFSNKKRIQIGFFFNDGNTPSTYREGFGQSITDASHKASGLPGRCCACSVDLSGSPQGMMDIDSDA
jgi:hypothetical protein